MTEAEMLACPNCNDRLARKTQRGGVYHQCPACGGRMVGVGLLRKERAAQDFLSEAWQGARQGAAERGRPCPHCGRAMRQVPVRSGLRRDEAASAAQAGAGALDVDVCVACACVWFDPGEWPSLHSVPPASLAPQEADLPPKAREILALDKIKKQKREYESRAGGEGPEASWQYLPAMFGLPVEFGAPAVRTRPWVTWGAAAVAVIVFLVAWGLARLADVNGVWGFIPAEWHRYGGLTLASSFFLHGGPFHIISNVYFLLVFGDNVEDELGKARFVGLLAAAHVAGMVAHGLVDPRSSIPCVGASAGISGVIAYYAVAFPRARLGFFLFLRFHFRWIRMSAAVAFALWIALALFGAWQQVRGFSSVSALAHLGGAAVGLVAALARRLPRREALDLAGVRRGGYDRSERPGGPLPP